MPPIQIKWSSLLNITDLEFTPEPPRILKVSDEIIQTISWLTAATRHNRLLLRCDENGALLVADPWSLFNVAENDELHPADGVPDVFTATVTNKAVLVATSTMIVKLSFVRVSGGASEHIYVPPHTLYWYPYTTYSVTATVVPASGGSSSYVGITSFV